MSNARFPNELPLVMKESRPAPGIGRGFGRGFPSSPKGDAGSKPGLQSNVQYSQQSPAAPAMTPPSPYGRGQLLSGGGESQQRPAYVPFKQALSNANQPLREIEQLDNLVKSYIPGLHVPGQNFPLLPEPQSNAVNRLEIPPELIREYRAGSKHPVSAMEEFSKKLKVQMEFKETALENQSVYSFGLFGNTCFVEGQKFPQGVGKTKKEAKTLAAKNAFDAILAEGLSIVKGGDLSDPVAPPPPAAAASSNPAELRQPQMFNTQKNAAAIFNEYCAKRRIEANISVSDIPTKYGFECDIKVDGKLIAKGHGTNKKDAKNKACDEALRVLESRTSESSRESHFDWIAKLVKKHFELLKNDCDVTIENYNVLAAFVVMQFVGDDGRVVALATGDSCSRNEALTDDGRVVVDCHAEVLARRSFIKWLVKQMEDAARNKGRNVTNDSVFELDETSNRFLLKDTVSFHFYVNKAPCGDASAFQINTTPFISDEEYELISSGLHDPIFSHAEHGFLKAKGEEGVVTVNVSQIPSERASHASAPTDDADHTPMKFRTMSCSDKILKWNVLGLQGALGSHLVEPIYLNSITLGSNFEFGHTIRALCCRLSEDINDQLPEGYRLNHPLVGRVSVYEASPAMASSRMSINWSAVDELIEIIDGCKGRTMPDSPYHIKVDPTASRLCKYGFSARFRELMKGMKRSDFVNCSTYRDVKESSTDYQKAKMVFYSWMESFGFGSWMSRSSGLDEFAVGR